MSGSYDTSFLGQTDSRSVTRVKTENIAPSTFLTFQTIVPGNTSEYTQVFSNSSINLNDPNMQYCITRITAVIDTAGIYNIPVTDYINWTIATLPQTPIEIKPGLYIFDTNPANPVSINNLMKCMIFTQGPNAYKPYVIGPTVNTYKYGSYIAKILGLDPNVTYTGLGPNPNQVTEAPSSNNIVDATGGFDTISIGCDLVDLASTVSPNYVIMVGIEANSFGVLGGVITRTSSMSIPINKKSFNSITWRLFNRDGSQITLLTPIIIHTEISGWRI